MSITSIIFAVFELTLNFGATNIGGITFREKLLVYCFIFSSFILVSYYENVVLLFMLVVPTWRSAVSIEELNQSPTMFHTMFDKDIIYDNNLPRIRQELILDRVNFSELMSLEVPEKFDENLVYMVLCEYADYFIHSSGNYHNSRRLYNKIIITTKIYHQNMPLKHPKDVQIKCRESVHGDYFMIRKFKTNWISVYSSTALFK